MWGKSKEQIKKEKQELLAHHFGITSGYFESMEDVVRKVNEYRMVKHLSESIDRSMTEGEPICLDRGGVKYIMLESSGYETLEINLLTIFK